MSFGKKIKIQRTIKDLTQKQLADRIGKSQEFICYVESDKRIPDLLEAETIAKALDTTVPALFYGKKEKLA